MFKRELIFLSVVVAVAALLSLVPSHAHATAVYPIQGKVIDENLPEIKWEDGDPGMDPDGKVSFLGSSRDNLIIGNKTYERIDNYSTEKAMLDDSNLFKKLLWRSLIFKIIINW